MTTSTLITLSTEEVSNMIADAVKRAMMQLENRTRQTVLSVSDIANDSGFSSDTVRNWIQEGRTAPGGRKVKLKIMDGLSETYRVRWELYQAFLAAFPDITCPSSKKAKARRIAASAIRDSQ